MTTRFELPVVEFSWSDGRLTRLVKLTPYINLLRTFLLTHDDVDPDFKAQAQAIINDWKRNREKANRVAFPWEIRRIDRLLKNARQTYLDMYTMETEKENERLKRRLELEEQRQERPRPPEIPTPLAQATFKTLTEVQVDDWGAAARAGFGGGADLPSGATIKIETTTKITVSAGPDATFSFEAADSKPEYKTFGGSSQIFRVVAKTAEAYALKLIDLRTGEDQRDSHALFEAEAKAWKLLVHDHILPFLGYTIFNDKTYLVSHWMENGDARKWIAREPGVDRARLLRQAASAIKHIHDEGYIHGDIKGTNILISERGDAKVCDFGLTKNDGSATKYYIKNHFSLRWRAAELWRPPCTKTLESDVWAFGMTIAEILTNKDPFEGVDDELLSTWILTHKDRPEPPPQSSQTDLALWKIAERCWEENPAARLDIATVYRRLCDISPE